MNGYARQQSSESRSIEGNEGTPPKRKTEESPGSHMRAKRNRYISIACNECKRRKIKCNGQTPCQRCGNLSLECLYTPNCCNSGFKDSEEFRQMNAHIQSLQEQVDNLYSNLNSLRSGPDSVLSPDDADSYPRQASTSHSKSQLSFHDPASPARSRARHPPFQGPTSSAFNFDVAKSSLQTMGITASEDLVVMAYEDPASPPQLHQAPTASMTAQPAKDPKDPLWSIGKEEAIRLCRLYEEEVGIMYPMFDMEIVIDKANALFTFMESAARTGLVNRSRSGTDAVVNDDTNILRMILATALTVEESGESEQGRRLFESIRSTFEGRLWEPADIKGLILLVIVAQYHFHLDEEAQAYRIIGLTARLCFEMGLHRCEVLTKTFNNEEECAWVSKLFWSIYVLDRRWSFGTGMPFALQDADIDPLLPEPDNSTPYLTAMIAYSRISSKVWRSVAGFDGSGNEIRKDEIGYLDYQILQWQKNIPESLKFYHTDPTRQTGVPGRPLHRLQVLLYLRANQMRILIYRAILHSATSIMENRAYAQTVVEVAKDTIRVLSCLNQTTDIYRAQQVCFNYFLVAALGVIFLAVSHAPVEFSRQVRDEFYMALDLVKGFSTKSYISKRLWKTIKGLKEVGPKLGLVSRQVLGDANDPHSSAAVAMAGLAGHQVDESAIFPQVPGASPLGTSPMNGLQMSYELTNLFEAAGGYGLVQVNPQGTEGMNGYMGQQGEMSQGVEGFPSMFGNEEELSRIMRDLF